jgi:hypothetical protein
MRDAPGDRELEGELDRLDPNGPNGPNGIAVPT